MERQASLSQTEPTMRKRRYDVFEKKVIQDTLYPLRRAGAFSRLTGNHYPAQSNGYGL